MVVDFTIPDATVQFAQEAARHGVAHAIGTTGNTDLHLGEIKKAAEKTAIVRAGNMSLGVNLLVKLTTQVAAALDADFDIEIIEAHHNKKIDAPSGTALMLGEAAAEGRGVALQDSVTQTAMASLARAKEVISVLWRSAEEILLGNMM